MNGPLQQLLCTRLVQTRPEVRKSREMKTEVKGEGGRLFSSHQKKTESDGEEGEHRGEEGKLSNIIFLKPVVQNSG